MKRRNADCGKLRRPIKRNKITEGMYGSTTVLYMKFLVLWAIVITADFMFMFRFEYLWPFWLLLRSVHDSFKYKGLAFSVLFVCIAITSDLVCLFFIPVHWLLFAASTYVWVQYVWHTDKGICLPTIILWMLFVYLEAGIRWKDSRHMPHLDLCRPFAAHCIGYPVVTLGFGFKSYVGYRIRQRKQREVAKENEFYMELLQAALPQEEPILLTTSAASCNESNNVTSNLQTSTQITSNASTLSSSASSMVTATQLSTSVINSNHLCAQNSSTQTTLNLNNLSMSNNAAHNTAVFSTTTTNLLPNGTAHINASTTATNHNHQQQNPLGHHHQQNSNSNSNHLPNGQSYHHNNHSRSNSISTTAAATSTTNSNHGIATATFSSATTTTASTLTANNNPLLSSLCSPSATFNDDKNYEALNANNLNIGGGVGSGNGGGFGSINSSGSNVGGGGGATANGHIGGGGAGYAQHNTKIQRRSTDKEHKNHRNGSTSSSSANETDCKRRHNNNNNSNLQADNNSSSNNNNNNNCNGKEKSELENNNSAASAAAAATTSNTKDKHDHQRDSTRKSNTHSNSKSNHNNNDNQQYEVENVVTIEPVERTKGRRNRSKKDNANKDNQQQQNLNNSTTTTQSNGSISTTSISTTATNFRLHNADASSVSSLSSSSTTTTTSSSSASASSKSLTSTATSALSNIASKVVSKICDSCLKFEADIKKYRSEISHMKQIENELRQKLETNLTTKSCLQAKQKECDELEKRVLELTNARHADFKASERRLTEERRQKQSLEAQLNNEKKARKLAEEKAARPECSLQCKQRKQQMEEELNKLRRELKATEDGKLLAEQHGRKWEQELRMFEAEIRNRDTNQQPTEMLMKALAAMQDQNCTLEKNLSAETRVKLDLFSALGDAKRQLEISESRRRSKEDEVLDLKAKIAQILAVMPTDNLCLPAMPGSTGGSAAGSMLRMNDTPPLKCNVTGPASPIMLTSQNVVAATSQARVVQHAQHQQQHHHQQQQQQHQQQQQQQHQQQHPQQQQQQPPPPNSPGDYNNAQRAPPQDYCSGLVPVSVANSVLTVSGVGGVGVGVSVSNNNNGLPVAGASSLDPNATVYTPKTLQTGPGGLVIVGGVGVGNGTNGEA